MHGIVFSPSRLHANLLQDAFTAANGGMVIGNGIVEYAGFINHDMGDLPYMGGECCDALKLNRLVTALITSSGIMAEHFAVFEAVLSNGSFNASLIDNNMQLITEAANMNKTVVIALWPGPCITVGFLHFAFSRVDSLTLVIAADQRPRPQLAQRCVSLA